MNPLVSVTIPHETVNDDTVTLIEWLVTNGERVNQGQSIASVETSKAVMQIEATATGFLEALFQPGDEIGVGKTLCHLHESPLSEPANSTAQVAKGSWSSESGPVPDLYPSIASRDSGDKSSRGPGKTSAFEIEHRDQSPRENSGNTRFSKQAANLLKQHDLDSAVFAGRGLVSSSDILAHLRKEIPAPPSVTGAADAERTQVGSAFVKAQRFSSDVPVRSEKLSPRKQAEVKSLSLAHRNTLMSIVSVVVPTVGLRAAASQHGGLRGNTTALMIFEVARLLRRYPQLNAFYSEGRICFYEEVNIGFAIDAGHGLKVPVIHHADQKGLLEISREMQELIVGYLNNELTPESLSRGTFTVSDLSGDGVFIFYPLLNHMQSATLGVGSEFFMPGSSVGMFNLVLSFDHQLSEGRQAAEFLNELRRRLKTYEAAFESVGGKDRKPLRCSKCLTPLGELHEMHHYLLLVLQPDGSTRNMCSVCVQGL